MLFFDFVNSGLFLVVYLISSTMLQQTPFCLHCMENSAELRVGSIKSWPKRERRRVNGEHRRSELNNIENVIQPSRTSLALKRRQSIGNQENACQQCTPVKTCRLSSNGLASTISTNDRINIPVIIKPPFLYRNHFGYKILSNDDAKIEDVKAAVSVEAQIECLMGPKICKQASSQRLENSIVQLKKREMSLAGNYANDILVFEFFKVVSNVDVIVKSKCDIYICGVLNGATKYKEKLLTYPFSEDEIRRKPSYVVEFIPPKPSSEFDQLYLYVEAKIETKMTDEKRSNCSSTESSSKTVLYGAYCISSKNQKPKSKEESPWLTDFKKTRIQLINAEKEEVNSDDLVTLFERCHAQNKQGGAFSLSFEISNENEYYCDEFEKINEWSKKPKCNAKPVNDRNITYNVSQLIKAKCSLHFCSYTSTLQISNGRGENGFEAMRIVLIEPSEYQNQNAHEKATTIFKCLFCAKTFSNCQLLKFHLEHSYPSFNFNFKTSVIQISYDVTSSLETAKATSKAFTEQLIKNRISPPVSQNVTKSSLLHKRLIKFPYKFNYHFSIVPAPVEGLYGYEISTQYLQQYIKLAFFFLWNTFYLERSNRRFGTLSMFDRLYRFIQRNYDKIEEFHLKSVWNIFLIYQKNTGALNEKQFFTLSLYGSKFQNKWFGCGAPVTKK